MRLDANEKDIRKDIERSIKRCMNTAFGSCSPKKPQEPDFVAELVDGLPNDIYKTLKAYMPQYQFVVSGVFCHQKPLADYGSKKSPELGDILLVYIEENKYSVRKCNALLMQAKKIDKSPYKVPTTEEHQLKLYEEWPTFKLKRAGRFNGIKTDIQPKTLNSGAQYLLLQSPCTDEKNVCCAYPDKELVTEKKLSEQIIDLMKFFTGRTFLLNPPFEEDWSKMIFDLLLLSGVSTFNRRASGRVKVSRRHDYGDLSLLDGINNNLFTNETPPLDREFETNDDTYPDGAVSCLLIYAQEKNEDFQKEQLEQTIEKFRYN